MTIEQMTQFFGWCAILNIAMLAIAAAILIWQKEWVLKIHSGMFGVPEQELSIVYFKYLAYYKIAILVFNLVPYFALRFIA
ncbi:MAG: DUF6868 family protein [Anderseniella sp.]